MGKDLKGKELGKNLSQRKDGRYEAKFTDNFGKRHSIYGEKLSEVRKKLNEALYKKEHNITNINAKFTVNEWFFIWINQYKQNVQDTTLNRYVRYYDNNIKEYIGHLRIQNVKQIHIQNLFNRCISEKNLSQSTLKHLQALLKSIFEMAKYNEYITNNPVINISFNNESKIKKRRFLSSDEQKIFLQYAKNYSYYNLYVFLIYTGCRIGEALALKWDDIDFSNSFIHINKTFGKTYNYQTHSINMYTHKPKTKAGNRHIPMHNVIKQMLNDLYAVRNDKCPLIFHTKNLTNIMPDDVWNNIQVIVNKINQSNHDYNFEKFSPHSLRHTFASNCFESDINAKIVQHYMGHTNIKMTLDLYTHVSTEKYTNEINNLNDIL